MKSILITGASGGFGIEFAKQLEGLGHSLLLHGRDKARLQLSLDSLKHPERHTLLTADLSSEAGLLDLIEQLQAYSICGLVNNAGFGIWGSFHQREGNAHRDLLYTDFNAPILLTHALLPSLIRQHGFIINVSSLAGETPLPTLATYAAAKAGLSFWSEALRTELSQKVRVVTLAPGPSPTGFREISGMPMSRGGFFRSPSKQVVACAIRCLQHGGGFVVPSWRHQLLRFLQDLIPRALSLKLMNRYLR